MKKILDLCGGTGAWSKPYADNGYEVHNITLPFDVRYYDPPRNTYGILAAVPCTHFALSGAQYWKEKDKDGRTWDAVSILTACLMIIARVQPVFWCIENPEGRIKDLLGTPDLQFNPCDFGDPYNKRTYLWGKFNKPEYNYVEPIRESSQGSWLMKLGGKSKKTKELRSITPQGFAQAFYKANK